MADKYRITSRVEKTSESSTQETTQEERILLLEKELQEANAQIIKLQLEVATIKEITLQRYNVAIDYLDDKVEALREAMMVLLREETRPNQVKIVRRNV